MSRMTAKHRDCGVDADLFLDCAEVSPGSTAQSKTGIALDPDRVGRFGRPAAAKVLAVAVPGLKSIHLRGPRGYLPVSR
jgi:hypothetical protein